MFLQKLFSDVLIVYMAFIFFCILYHHNQNSYLEQHTLSTRHLSLPSNNRRACHPQRNSQRLERALRAVVVIVAVQAVDVHRHARALRKTVQAVRDHLARKVADLFAAQAEVADAVGAVGQVYYGAREGFVERAVGGAEAGEASGCVEGGFEGLDCCRFVVSGLVGV